MICKPIKMASLGAERREVERIHTGGFYFLCYRRKYYLVCLFQHLVSWQGEVFNKYLLNDFIWEWRVVGAWKKGGTLRVEKLLSCAYHCLRCHCGMHVLTYGFCFQWFFKKIWIKLRFQKHAEQNILNHFPSKTTKSARFKKKFHFFKNALLIWQEWKELRRAKSWARRETSVR